MNKKVIQNTNIKIFKSNTKKNNKNKIEKITKLLKISNDIFYIKPYKIDYHIDIYTNNLNEDRNFFNPKIETKKMKYTILYNQFFIDNFYSTEIKEIKKVLYQGLLQKPFSSRKLNHRQFIYFRSYNNYKILISCNKTLKHKKINLKNTKKNYLVLLKNINSNLILNIISKHLKIICLNHFLLFMLNLAKHKDYFKNITNYKLNLNNHKRQIDSIMSMNHYFKFCIKLFMNFKAIKKLIHPIYNFVSLANFILEMTKNIYDIYIKISKHFIVAILKNNEEIYNRSFLSISSELEIKETNNVSLIKNHFSEAFRLLINFVCNYNAVILAKLKTSSKHLIYRVYNINKKSTQHRIKDNKNNIKFKEIIIFEKKIINYLLEFYKI